MRAVIQRSKGAAEVSVDGEQKGQIDSGLVVYLGIGKDDTEEDLKWLSNKIVNMRIFSDAEGKMNKALKDVDGGLLIISQFTLFASTKKGNRPSYLESAPPAFANEMYEQFISHTRKEHDCPVAHGVFGGDMKVSFTNDGPVTIILDTKNKQ